MRTLGTFLAVIAALVWSALMWGGYALVMLSSSLLMENADRVGLPREIDGWASLLDGLLRDYGAGIAAAFWAIGILAIILVRALFNWLVGTVDRSPAAPPQIPAPMRHDPPPPQAAAPRLPEAVRWGRNSDRTLR